MPKKRPTLVETASERITALRGVRMGMDVSARDGDDRISKNNPHQAAGSGEHRRLRDEL